MAKDPSRRDLEALAFRIAGEALDEVALDSLWIIEAADEQDDFELSPADVALVSEILRNASVVIA